MHTSVYCIILQWLIFNQYQNFNIITVHQHMSGLTVSVCAHVCGCERETERLMFSEALTLCFIKGLVTKGVFSAVGHVQKAVLILLLVV